MTNKKEYTIPSLATTEVELENTFMTLSVPVDETPDEDIDESDKSKKKKPGRTIWDSHSGDMWK